MKINVVMVEPEIPQNTGNIARTCAAIGAKLHLVKPLGFRMDDKYLKRAGLDYWDKLDIEVHENLEEFLKKYAVGPAISTQKETTKKGVGAHCMRPIDKEYLTIDPHFFLASTKSQQTYADIDYTKFEEIFILFGKETKGLPEGLIQNNMKQAIRIPMRESLRSLNLSNSVAIIVYEVLRQNGFDKLEQESQYFTKKY